jgi:sialic acid synthase SpsE
MVFRRSLYFVRHMPEGAIANPEDIRRIRPGMGIPPRNFDAWLGRREKTTIAAGTVTSWDLFEE